MTWSAIAARLWRDAGASHVPHFFGDLVVRGVAVRLVVEGLEHRIGVVGIEAVISARWHHPDAHAFRPPGVDVPSVLEGGLGIGGVEAAGVDDG